MEVRVNGSLPFGVTAKDLILAIIGKMGVGGGVGHVIEYTGEAIRSLSMAGRMTVCNMSIEGGARAGLIAPDQTTFEYMEGRPQVPQGEEFERAKEKWLSLATDPGAKFDKLVEIDAASLSPYVSWGTNPGMVTSVNDTVPDPASFKTAGEKTAARNFEGRQGAGGRTHLVSPEMAAAAAIAGHFVDVRDWK